MKALLLILAALQGVTLGINTEYDKFTDTTIIRNTQSIMPVRPGSVLFEVVASVKGKTVSGSKPTGTAIVITSRADQWVFLGTANHFRVLYNDSERYTLGTMRRVSSDIDYGSVVETLYLDVTMDDIEKLSKANKLEIQIGPLESEIKTEQIASIGRWLKLFEPIK
jgi:hypothetical protein